MQNVLSAKEGHTKYKLLPEEYILFWLFCTIMTQPVKKVHPSTLCENILLLNTFLILTKTIQIPADYFWKQAKEISKWYQRAI